MIDVRQKDQGVAQDQSRRTTEEATQTAKDQANRLAKVATDAGHEATRTGAEAAPEAARAVQQMWEQSFSIARDMMQRSSDQLTSSLGLTGDAGREATEKSTRNIEAVVSSGTVVAQSLQDVSREWTEFYQKGLDRSLTHISSLMSCRTPQEIAAKQSEWWLQTVEHWMQSSRRLSEMSSRMAEESGRKISEKGRRAA